jgi:hypothetical protein
MRMHLRSSPSPFCGEGSPEGNKGGEVDPKMEREVKNHVIQIDVSVVAGCLSLGH